MFEPGSSVAQTDLTLEITRKKPSQIFGGWANTGTGSSGRSRYFAGFAAGVEALNDLTLSYQLTTGTNLLRDPSLAKLSGDEWPHYLSQSGRVTIPLGHRQSLEFAPNFVATSQRAPDRIITQQNTTFELPVTYRSALSNFSSTLAGYGDLYAGVAPRWLERKTRFSGLPVADGHASVFNLMLGWNNTRHWSGGGTTSADLRLVVNPGGVTPGSASEVWNSFSNGRVTGMRYAYAAGSIQNTLPLPPIGGLSGFVWSTTLSWQLAGQALPDTEQMTLGGFYGVRGFSLDDGSVDTGFVLRNELRLPTLSLLSRLGPAVAQAGLRDALTPFLFADVGYGHSFNYAALTINRRKADVSAVSVGAGLDYALATNLQIGAIVGVALTEGPLTDRGAVTAQMRAMATF